MVFSFVETLDHWRPQHSFISWQESSASISDFWVRESTSHHSLVLASCCCGKTHWKKALKKGRILDSQFQNAVCLGEEGMAAGIWGSCFHVFLQSWRERGNASSTQFFFSFLCSPRAGWQGNEASKDRQAFSLQLAPSAGGNDQTNCLLSWKSPISLNWFKMSF